MIIFFVYEYLFISIQNNEKILKILDIYENFEYKLNSEYTIGEKGNIFGRPLFEEIANKHQLVDIKICSNQKKANQYNHREFGTLRNHLFSA